VCVCVSVVYVGFVCVSVDRCVDVCLLCVLGVCVCVCVGVYV